ncbi:MAG: FHA domain-containing protein [Phycisphaerales bacterium]|nr:MAG: FHA domain-containing protein [Phycisphaerales bacterium]
MIEILCKCNELVQIPDSAIGKTRPCPSCRAELRFVGPEFDPREDRFSGVFELIAGPSRVGEQLFLGGPGPIEVGKRPGNDILLEGQHVSRSHCRLLRTEEGWRLVDSGSTNGVYANGKQVQTWHLSDGDIIRIGKFKLKYSSRLATGSVDDSSFYAEQVLADRDYGISDDDLSRLSEGQAIENDRSPAPLGIQPLPESPVSTPSEPDQAETELSSCPSCDFSLGEGAVICVNCGLDLRTGVKLKGRRSPGIPLLGLPLMATAGLVAAVVLSVAYSYAIVYIPFIYLNILATLCFGSAIGWVLKISSLVLRKRNPLLVALAGMLCGFVGLYFAWAVDMVVRLPQLGLEASFTLNPNVLWDYVRTCYEEGTWTMFGATQKGMWLGIVYLVEAGIIVGAATLVSIGYALDVED